MYCPQCGGTNDDSARFCTTCGLDIDGYRQKWQQGSASTDRQAQQPGPPYQQVYEQASYDQRYQQPYQQYQSAQPYPPSQSYRAVPRIPSHMGWAIATLILCFWPTGIVAVVYASQVGNKLAFGDYAGAQASSRKAKLWSWISLGIAVAGIVISIIVALVAAASTITTY